MRKIKILPMMCSVAALISIGATVSNWLMAEEDSNDVETFEADGLDEYIFKTPIDDTDNRQEVRYYLDNGHLYADFSVISISSDIDEAFRIETGERVYPENYGGYDYNDCEFIIKITDGDTAPYKFLTDKYSVIRFEYTKYSVMYLNRIIDDLLDSIPDFAENSLAWVNYDVGIIMEIDADFYDMNLDRITELLSDLPEDLPIRTIRDEVIIRGGIIPVTF